MGKSTEEPFSQTHLQPLTSVRVSIRKKIHQVPVLVKGKDGKHLTGTGKPVDVSKYKQFLRVCE